MNLHHYFVLLHIHYYTIITNSLLRHYYAIITPLLHHYYVIITSLLQLAKLCNNDFGITYYYYIACFCYNYIVTYDYHYYHYYVFETGHFAEEWQGQMPSNQ